MRMHSDHHILTLLGLCKRAGMLEIGEEPVEAVARAKVARVLFLAADAADNTARRVRHFAEAGNCLWLRVPFTKEELGRALGRTSCAITAVTDIGFAANIVGRLAEMDPARYAEPHAILQIKAKRAAERKAEMLAHKKNIRTGKVKRKAPPPPPPPPAEPRPEHRPAPDRKPLRSGAPRSADGHRPPYGDGRKPAGGKRPAKANRPPARPADRFAGSRPVKKGKGSFRKSD